MRLPASVLKLATVFSASLLLSIPLPLAAENGETQERQKDPTTMEILGTVEDVAVMGEDLVLEARMDTGATSSSINALEQETFERDDEEWIRFEVIDPADEDARITLERPIERTARIRRHSGDPEERHVVRLDLCMGGQRVEADTTLVDRTQLTYQLLVGRSHMAGHILVDSGNEHLRAPDCPKDDGSGDDAE